MLVKRSTTSLLSDRAVRSVLGKTMHAQIEDLDDHESTESVVKKTILLRGKSLKEVPPMRCYHVQDFGRTKGLHSTIISLCTFSVMAVECFRTWLVNVPSRLIYK